MARKTCFFIILIYIMDNTKIPRILHMTYKVRKLSPIVYNKWKKLNPHYTFTFSDDKDCYKFIEKNFSKEYAEFFNKIVFGPNKADFWRLCKLYIEGGVYVDIDIYPYINLDNFIKNYTFCSCINNGNAIFQAVIGSTKNNVIIERAIKFFYEKRYEMNLLKNIGYNASPTHNLYTVIQNIIRRIPRPFILYNIKINNEKNIEKIYFYYELLLQPKKGLDGYYVIDKNKLILFKSRFDNFNKWKNNLI